MYFGYIATNELSFLPFTIFQATCEPRLLFECTVIGNLATACLFVTIIQNLPDFSSECFDSINVSCSECKTPAFFVQHVSEVVF